MLKNLKEKLGKRKRYLHSNIDYLLKVNQLDIKSLSIEANLPSTTISRLKRDDSNPTIDSVEPIADFFRVDVNDLLYEDMASKEYQSKKSAGKAQYIPIIKIEDLNKTSLYSELASVSMAVSNASNDAFGVQIETESLAPIFKDNSIAIIEPNLEPRDADYILCLLENDKIPVFRQLFIDGSSYFFKPINPNYGSMTACKKFKILGVVIKIIESYR